jgi:hypothetical protein
MPPLAPGSRPGAFFGGARSLHIAAGSDQEEARFRPVPRPRRRTSGVPTASEAHLSTVANPRAGVFRCGRCPHPPQPKRPWVRQRPFCSREDFSFKKHSKYAFFAVRRRRPLGGSKQFRPPPAPKGWPGTKGEAMSSQSLTACKPCFRHASTLERARPSTGDAARNEAAAHRIKRAAGRG